MAMNRWHPAQALSRREQFLMRRLRRVGKLFGFLREHRHELFDEAFQTELETMYRESGAGKDPVPPAMMAMVILLQAYTGVSDAEAVEMSVVDMRWQMVLGCLNEEEPAFSQGALYEFRNRLIRHDMDRRLLERTIELAKKTKAFDYKHLPKSLRVAIDSSPLEGAGRVEDTINLLAHAARKVLECVALVLGRRADDIAICAAAPLLVGTSIKKALDLEWSDPQQKASAIVMLVEQLDALETWVREQIPAELNQPPLAEHLATLRQLRGQDLEPDPSGGGSPRIRRGVAEDRRVSVQDKDMRHGRKSKSKRFNGYKRHLAADIDTKLILACAITPANRPEEEATPELKADISCGPDPREIDELYIDRGYIGSELVEDLVSRSGEVICKPWVARNGSRFRKSDFHIDMRRLTITCPAGQTERFEPGSVVEFDPETCSRCPLRTQCTLASPATGRTVNIAHDERLQHRLRKLVATPMGRARLRERIMIEHRLAHLSRKQGRKARYMGSRKNLFDLRRIGAVLNLETIHRVLPVAA